MKNYLFVTIILFCVACSNHKEDAINKTQDSTDIAAVSNYSSVKNGDFEERYENRIIKKKGIYSNGIRIGQWASFYPNGQPWSEVFYTKGKKDGPTTTWYENGQKRYQGEYKNDAQSGKWYYWNEAGKLEQEVDYGKTKNALENKH